MARPLGARVALFTAGGVLGAGGTMIVGGEFLGAFGVAAALLAVPALLYYVFFAKMEEASQAHASA